MRTSDRLVPLDTKDLLFGALDLPQLDSIGVLAEVMTTDANLWFYDAYRNTRILPLRTQTGKTSWAETQNRSHHPLDFHWTTAASELMKTYFQEHVFPWSGDRCRIVVLRTSPGERIPIHIDCTADALGTVEHKFRLVLQGRVDSLYFLTEGDKRVHVPEVSSPFLMDGTWPHGMINESPADKYTLCMGAPWRYSPSYPPLKQTLWRSDYRRPSDYKNYLEVKAGNSAQSAR